MKGTAHPVVFLPGAVMPADLAYGDLVDALGDRVEAVVKGLELYATDSPPEGYGVELEIDGALRAADAAGFETFHLVGYSGGGGVSISLAARHPKRLRSLTLMEPAWAGNTAMTAPERGLWDAFAELRELPPPERMRRFVAIQLAPGIEPDPPPPGPPPPGMEKRPAGINAITRAFEEHEVDMDDLRAFGRPVFFWMGALSNPDYYRQMAGRLAEVFGDFTLEVGEGLHHFRPAHRFEPEALARSLLAFWDRAAGGDQVPAQS